MQLDRADLIRGLQDLIGLARERGLRNVSIRIVGGAALRLAYFDRQMTSDIDAQIHPIDEVRPLIDVIAREHGWRDDWLNADASIFVPSWGGQLEWLPIFDDDAVSIAVASVGALLAMKLNAARPGRDTHDIVNLLTLNEIDSVEDAESLFERFYPGESLSDRALQLLEHIYELGLPPMPESPPPVDLR